MGFPAGLLYFTLKMFTRSGSVGRGNPAGLWICAGLLLSALLFFLGSLALSSKTARLERKSSSSLTADGTSPAANHLPVSSSQKEHPVLDEVKKDERLIDSTTPAQSDNDRSMTSDIEPARVPAVFLSTTNSDPLSASLLGRIADEFSTEVASRHLMPASAEYRALWEESRTKADDEFRNLFGAEELEKARQSNPSP